MTKDNTTKTTPTKPVGVSSIKKISKYHFPVFILIMAISVGYMLFNVYQILSAPTDNEYLASKQTSAEQGLDLESVRAVNRLYYSDEMDPSQTIITNY